MPFFTRRKKVDVSGSGAGGFGAGENLRLKKHFTMKDLQLRTATKAAAEAFLADFPNGEFYSMETDSGGNNLCGLFAIRNSMLAFARQNPLLPVPVPTIYGLLKAFRVYAIPHLKQRHREMGLPNLEIHTNNFSGDELRLIFKGWAKGLGGLMGGLIRNHWGGVDLGLVTPVKMDADNVELQPLCPHIEVSEPTQSGLPILRPYILNRGLEHWEGMAQVPRKREQQSLPQLGHQQPAMRPSIHPLPDGQMALPGSGIQPQQYPQQPQIATPSLDGNPLRSLFEYTPVPALSRTEQPQFDLNYSIDLNYELDPPSGESHQPPLPPSSEPLYESYESSLSLTPELQVESLRGGCPLLDIQSGMYATPEPPPPSTNALLDLGVWQDFPPTWTTPLSPIPCPLPPTPQLPAPPNSFLFPGQVPLQEPGWTFSPSPSPSTPCTQPMSQHEMEQQAWRQLERIMAGLRGQLQVQGGGQAPIPHVQPPMPRAAPKRRMLSEVEEDKGQEEEMLSEVEDDKGQEEERPAKKRRK